MTSYVVNDKIFVKNYRQHLLRLSRKLYKDAHCVLGYPVRLGFNYDYLTPFLKYFINNIGDPFVEGSYRIEVKKIEREVLQFFRKLFHLPDKDYWGYVTNGGTEGNLFGLFLARELHPKGIIYCSQDTHYSIFKIARILSVPACPVSSQKNGELSYDDLLKKIKNPTNNPPIIVANIGTVMKGAVDDIEKILKVLRKIKAKKFYIHVDAAFGGMLLPFLKNSPRFDFRLPIGSLSVSGYKVIGSPLSCGVVMTKKSLLQNTHTKHFIPYIKTSDDTISGSRSGFLSLILWSAIQKSGLAGFKKDIENTHKLSEWFLGELKKLGWPAWKNPFSTTVVIKKPTARILKKWQLASQGDSAHVVVLPHVTVNFLKKFLADLPKP